MLANLVWNSAQWMGLLVMVGLILVIASAWLYWPQTRSLAGRWRWLLPMLRVAALLLLLVSLLRPALIRARTAQEQGAVLVLVDESRSMGIADAELPPSQQVAVADSLALLPAGSRKVVGQHLRELLEAFAPQLEETRRLLADLDYARLSGRGEAAAAKRLDESLARATNTASQFHAAAEGVALEAGLSNDLTAIAKWPDEKARAGWAKKSGEVAGRAQKRLSELQWESDKAAYQRDAALKRACEELATQSRLRLAERAITGADVGLLDRLPAAAPLFGFGFAGRLQAVPLRAGERPVRQLPLEASGRRTDIAGSVAAALNSIRGTETAAVVVFTDGRQAGAAGEAAPFGGVPVFGVLCGSEDSIRDLSLEAVEAPTGPFVGETITVKARLRSVNLMAKDVPVVMKLGAAEQRKQVSINPGEAVTAEFQVKLEKAGVHELELSVPELPGEASKENNRVRRPIKVHADRVRVAAISGYANWDYQYIRNALSRAPWAELTERIIEPGGRLMLGSDSLRQQGVILLFNVPLAALAPEQRTAIHQAVTQDGASVLLFSEDVGLLDAYARDPLMGDLLPYRAGQRPVWRTWPGDAAAFRAAPAADMDRSEVLRLADDAEQSRQQWAQLPAFFRYLALPELKPNVIHQLLVERDTSLPVLTESRLGMGRVFFIGMDETWRWRRNVGERDQDRLWLQLVRYSADPPYALLDGRLALDVERAAASPGEAVKARVRVDSRGLAGVEAPRPKLKLYRGDQLVREEQLEAQAQYGPGRYEAALRDLGEGEYRVEASLGEIGTESARSVSLPLTVKIDEMPELANLSADPQYLRQFAASTGGEMVTLDRLAELPRKLLRLREEAVQTVEFRLWDSWLLFGLVLSLLGIEWAMRKRLGLP